jgi:hypothetical protein
MAPVLLFGTVASLCCATPLNEEQWTYQRTPLSHAGVAQNSSWAHVYCTFWLRGLGTAVQMLKNVCRDDKLAWISSTRRYGRSTVEIGGTSWIIYNLNQLQPAPAATEPCAGCATIVPICMREC